MIETQTIILDKGFFAFLSFYKVQKAKVYSRRKELKV